MKVLVISSKEREIFSGNLLECLNASSDARKTTKFAVVIESNNGRRVTMARQDQLIKRLMAD